MGHLFFKCDGGSEHEFKQLRKTVICSLADAVCSNPPLTLCNVCSQIYGFRLDQRQMKAETISSGPALTGSTPTLADC